mmetsp:Transcript_2426/g.7006  ORF Transcript_2426/g.7006 Transcript_2426/m.7006 type:complete len:221 (+) Transcript_2426:1397-2059(+)
MRLCHFLRSSMTTLPQLPQCRTTTTAATILSARLSLQAMVLCGHLLWLWTLHGRCQTFCKGQATSTPRRLQRILPFPLTRTMTPRTSWQGPPQAVTSFSKPSRDSTGWSGRTTMPLRIRLPCSGVGSRSSSCSSSRLPTSACPCSCPCQCSHCGWICHPATFCLSLGRPRCCTTSMPGLPPPRSSLSCSPTSSSFSGFPSTSCRCTPSCPRSAATAHPLC